MSPTIPTIVTQLHNRRDARRRLTRFTCGCADPWTCPHKADTAPIRGEATIAAMRTLRDAGFPGDFALDDLRTAWHDDDARDELAEQYRYQTGTRPVTRLHPRTRTAYTEKAA